MSRSVFVTRRAIASAKTLLSSRDSSINKVSLVPYRSFSLTKTRNMKLCQFTYKEKPEEIRVGYVDGDNVIDISKADSSLPNTLIEILKNGGIEKVKNLKTKNPPSVPLSTVTLKAPITGMDKVLCVGLNYKDHCEEQNLTPPEVPMIFSKFASCVIGPNDAVRLRTDVTQKVDWEVELCIVMGKTASNVKAADAYDHVLGCTVAQDISARDWQKHRNGGQFLLGKAMDTFCPIGPWIVTLDETGDPENLDIKCSVNGVQKQRSNTNQLVHKIPSVIERLTSVMTLLPGDIVLTGTPGGVGMYRSPAEYLAPGARVASEIQRVGVLNTTVDKY